MPRTSPLPPLSVSPASSCPSPANRKSKRFAGSTTIERISAQPTQSAVAILLRFPKSPNSSIHHALNSLAGVVGQSSISPNQSLQASLHRGPRITRHLH